MMKLLKTSSFVCFIICLLGTLSNLFLYFYPEALLSTFPYYAKYTEVISAYALYAAVLTGITTLIMYCCYKYTKDKLENAKEHKRKTNPDIMNELVAFAKRHGELVSRINAATTLEEFEALKEDVNSYNNDAEYFAQTTGVNTMVITYSDYEAKKSRFETDTPLKQKTHLLPETVGEWVLSYQYTNELCFIKEEKNEVINKLKNCVGAEINFIPEPDNPFDENAVAIHYGGKRVGYIYKNDNAQHMVNDWVRMGRYFCGYISRYDEERNKIYYIIGFYKKA